MRKVFGPEYHRQRHAQRKAEALSILGNRCQNCGSTEDLVMDHIDPSTKTMNPSRAFSRSYEKFLAEVSLCQTLCEQCHRKKSAQEISVEHGGGKTGKQNCRCDPCRLKKNEYMREFKRKKRISSSLSG